MRNIQFFILVVIGVVLTGLAYFSPVLQSFGWFTFKGAPSSWNVKENIRDKGKRDLLVPKGLLYKQPLVLVGRTDVATVTPWLAPIVWEGTFEPTLIDAIYKQQNLTIATTVFAVGKYVRFLKDFLETAEKHYFLGFRVHYYIFTDQPEAIPAVTLAPNRTLTPIKIPGSNRWQEITLRRMERLQEIIQSHLIFEADYIFSLDVDSKFHGPWGAESLGQLVGALHPGYFKANRQRFPYERRPQSQAYIPAGEGDYYYGGAVIGGYLEDVYRLAKTCKEQLDIDASKSIEAAWQEESHLNKYFLYNKPTKVLSPEYLWQNVHSKPEEVKIIRFTQVIKNNAAVRPNPIKSQIAKGY